VIHVGRAKERQGVFMPLPSGSGVATPTTVNASRRACDAARTRSANVGAAPDRVFGASIRNSSPPHRRRYRAVQFSANDSADLLMASLPPVAIDR
jgi:hypothetical protein